MRTLVAMETYSFNRLIMGKVEIGNFYCLIGDNRILIFTEMFIWIVLHCYKTLLDSLNLIGCRGNVKSEFSKKKPLSQE